MICKLHIQTRLSGHRTILKNSFCTTPFKLANITKNKQAKELHLMIMSSSPGILDGDAYELKFELEAGSNLHLQTQSYQRLFNMKQSAAQSTEVYLQEGSLFCYLPHPTVPHKASSFTAINKIYLNKKCTLIFGEVLTCGRKLNGEVFSFSRYQNLTEIFLCNKLVIKENLVMQPALIDPLAIGQLENFTHQGSMLFLDEAVDMKILKAAIIELLAPQQDLVMGISETPVNGLVIRMLANGAEQLHDCMKEIAAESKKFIESKLLV